MSIQKLADTTIEQDSRFELRRIESHVVAETFVVGDFDRVGNEGFRRPVAYIGGANRTQARISMTAPVAQELASDEIAMTEPVAALPRGLNGRVDCLQKSGHILYTKGCLGWKRALRSSVSTSIATTRVASGR